MKRSVTLLAILLCSSCSQHLLSGIRFPDRTRPVARIETRGGVEYGVTTTKGILFLGRTAKKGPCRVHYFLGTTPIVEDGEVRHRGGLFYEADIDLKTPAVEILTRDPKDSDELVAILHRGGDVNHIPVKLAANEGESGDLIEWPGEDLPAGAGIFAKTDNQYRLFGLVAGQATMTGPDGERKLLVIAGTDRMRELLSTPENFPVRGRIKHRPDDIAVIKK